MSISHQQYADLASEAYSNEYPPGPRAPGKGERITLEGVTFELREYTTHPSGYQGMIFQRMDTGEIVVAHRGTEFTGEQAIEDVVRADGGMIVARANHQADEAIKLTRRALDLTKREESRYSPPPEVTVTGHSLGGCLAQITAHYFGLRGETFNAYGAASLNRLIPEGGDTVINHVMAADLVGAASPHFGQVRIYATDREIEVMRKANYHEGTGLATPRVVLSPLKEGFESHRLHNFLNEDADKKPDVSVLLDPHTRQRADQNAEAIQRYRGDVAMLRGTVTHTAQALPLTLHQHLAPKLAPGEPAARDEAIRENAAQREAEQREAWQRLRGDRPGSFAEAVMNRLPPTDPCATTIVPACNRETLQRDPEAFLDRMLAAVQMQDSSQLLELTRIAATHPAAQDMRAEAVMRVDRQEQQAELQHQQQQAQQREQQEQQAPRIGARSL